MRERRRRAVVVLTGPPRTGDRAAEALVRSLAELGVETVYLGVEDDPCRIAAAVAAECADAVELCMNSGTGVLLLRRLLGELGEVGRRDVSIVVHRMD
jgi:methylmalonyl-CoA mutase cobalamin-binding domain/chain